MVRAFDGVLHTSSCRDVPLRLFRCSSEFDSSNLEPFHERTTQLAILVPPSHIYGTVRLAVAAVRNIDSSTGGMNAA